MTEDHELHLPDALTHAAVPPPESPPTDAPTDALTHAAVPPLESPTTAEPAVESGAIVNRMEELFPLVWLGMLTVVSIIGIYSAVTKLP